MRGVRRSIALDAGVDLGSTRRLGRLRYRREKANRQDAAPGEHFHFLTLT
jgi:hypothetical protein